MGARETQSSIHQTSLNVGVKRFRGDTNREQRLYGNIKLNQLTEHSHSKPQPQRTRTNQGSRNHHPPQMNKRDSLSAQGIERPDVVIHLAKPTSFKNGGSNQMEKKAYTNANTTANTTKERRRSIKSRTRRNKSNSRSPGKSNASSGDGNKFPAETSLFSTTMKQTSSIN